jgi:hypothetical protein
MLSIRTKEKVLYLPVWYYEANRASENPRDDSAEKKSPEKRTDRKAIHVVTS